MNIRTVVVLVVATLVPVFCLDIDKQRCELLDQFLDQLRPTEAPTKEWEQSMARAVCEVEKFVNKSAKKWTPGHRHHSKVFTPETEYFIEETVDLNEQGPVDEDLKPCVAVIKGTNVKVDPACFAKDWLEKVSSKSEECKNLDPDQFFQKCSQYTKRSVDEEYEDSEEPLDTEELLDSEEQEPSEEYYSEEEPKEAEEAYDAEFQ